MFATVTSAAVLGVEAYQVLVEADISGGLPNVLVVGLPDAAVQESRERVRAAIKNAGLPFPQGRVVINLAPADQRKEGPAFDLPIAIALLIAQGVLHPKMVEDTVISGELALDGAIRPIKGAINIGLFASAKGFRRAVVPPANAPETAVVANVDTYAPATLADAVAYLQGRARLARSSPSVIETSESVPDLADVKGQAAVKRALEIAAAGMHNLLMAGPPGSGKTMLARRLPGILPQLSFDESVEVTRIHSTAGALGRSGLIRDPPFRAPHHTVSDAGLIGGGNVPKPGEVSLAHRGVLFLDELPEFSRHALEALRQPLEDGVVTISRARAAITFPARFMLVAAQNPCPCGYLGDLQSECVCTPLMRKRYKERISGPLLDRIDLRITVSRLTPEELLQAQSLEASECVKERVGKARALAEYRQGGANASLSGRELRRVVRLHAGAGSFAKRMATDLALSARGFDRLLRVARTIADLAGSADTEPTHFAEAASYREPI